MAPVSQCLNDGIELLIIRGLPKSNVNQLLAKELNGVAILAKDTPNADTRDIVGDFKHLVEVGYPQGRCLGHQGLQSIKGLLGCLRPLECLQPAAVGDRCHQRTKVLDELAIKHH